MLTTLLAAIILAAPWRLWLAIFYRPFTREFPRFAFKFALALTGYSLFVLAIAIHFSVLLFPLAVAAFVATAVDVWVARPAYGHARKLPLGSVARMNLPHLFDQEFFRKQSGRYGPVFKSCFFLRPAICVIGLERGFELMKSAGPKLRPPKYPIHRFIPGGFLRSLTPEDHVRYRKIFQDAFSPDIARDCVPVFAETIRAALDRATAQPGKQIRGEVYRMVFDSWLQLFFGIRPDEPVAERLREIYQTVDARFRRVMPDRHIKKAAEDLFALVQERSIATRGDSGRRSFLSQLVEMRPDAANDPVAIGNLAFLLHTSWGDVSGFVQWLLKVLSDHPSWTERLRAELVSNQLEKDSKGRDLIDRIILETFRLEQSEFLMRIADDDLPLEDYVIPKGWLVRICVRDSHRNPSIFPDPDTFNPDRFKDRDFARNEFSPFGVFQHSCLGPAVTMNFSRTFITELVRGFTWTTTSTGPNEYNSFCHWRPSSDFRIALTPQAVRFELKSSKAAPPREATGQARRR